MSAFCLPSRMMLHKAQGPIEKSDKGVDRNVENPRKKKRRIVPDQAGDGEGPAPAKRIKPAKLVPQSNKQSANPKLPQDQKKVSLCYVSCCKKSACFHHVLPFTVANNSG